MPTGHGPSDASRRTLPAPPRPAAAFQETSAAHPAADRAATPLGRRHRPLQCEHRLGRVDGNALNLGHGRPPVRVSTTELWHQMPRGPSTPTVERSAIRHRAVAMSAECASAFPPHAASLYRAAPLIIAAPFSAIM